MIRRVDSADWQTGELDRVWSKTPTEMLGSEIVALHGYLDYCRPLQELGCEFARQDAELRFENIFFFMRGGYFAFAYLNRVFQLLESCDLRRPWAMAASRPRSSRRMSDHRRKGPARRPAAWGAQQRGPPTSESRPPLCRTVAATDQFEASPRVGWQSSWMLSNSRFPFHFYYEGRLGELVTKQKAIDEKENDATLSY